MKSIQYLAIVSMVVLFTACNKTIVTENIGEMSSKINYPNTLRDDSVQDDYHGTIIKDPYRWLEDDNSEETKAWVTAQNAVTFDYLSKIPYRDSLKQRIEKLWNYERFGIPFKEGDYYYYFNNNGLQNQSVLYRVSNLTDAEGELVLDPNTFSEDGTASLGGMSFDKSGQYLAYQVSEGGSDWRTVKVRDVITGELLEDQLNWIKFSGLSWAANGFYYSRYPEPEADGELSAKNEYHSVYYHKLGDKQENDQLVYVDNDNPQRNVYASTSSDERFLILSTSESTSGNAFSIKALDTDDSLMPVVTAFDHDYSFVGNEGNILYFLTNANAPKMQLVSIDYDAAKGGNLTFNTVIPEDDDVLSSVTLVGGKFFAKTMHNASSKIVAYDLSGNIIGNVELPGIGTASSVSGEKDDSVAFFSFSSFTEPGKIISLDTESLTTATFRSPDVDFDSDDYITQQQWFVSKDGTRVPMFITHKKGITLDGSNPTLLYGYGGFDISITPGFSLTKIPLLEAGGVYAVANIRGGGEFGSEWHKAGTQERKQNVFDDFIAAAEYLIGEGYTSSEKLAIDGRSNGGLLVGACMTQRPDLYKVAFPGVGVLDMLRYHQFTIGWAWAGDYGRSDEPEAFDYLVKYSPLHNVKPAAYPSTMVVTADHDDRVVPAHSFKYIAELQHQHTGENPVLIRIDVSAGHGAGMPTDMRIQQAADILAFMFYEMEE